MNEWQERFIWYIDCYIREITQGKNEFFLSFYDVEEELLDGLDTVGLANYCVVIVNNRDYSEAVKMRNMTSVSKIVLLSEEGVRQIDSLKDFNEYPILAEDRKILWKCLQAALSLGSFNSDVKTFLEVILDQREIALSTLMKYLDKSTEFEKVSRPQSDLLRKKQNTKENDGRKSLVEEKLNANLPMLGMWKSREAKVLNKGKTGLILRASKYGVVENRLKKAVMSGEIAGLGIEKPITDGLSTGNIESIFEKVYYEEVKDFLKASSRSASSGDSRHADLEENCYENSCQYHILKMNSNENLADIENEWLKNKGQEDSGVELEWSKYQCDKEELIYAKEQFTHLVKIVDELNLEESKILDIKNILVLFRECFLMSWDAVTQATPICLEKFCLSACEYTEKYLELLTFLLKENRVRSAVVGTEVIQRIQTLFCRTEGVAVKMPFYHPICVFYYMCVLQMYQVAFGYEAEKKEVLQDLRAQIWLAVIQKAGMQFPIEYMTLYGKAYALDHNTVWQSGEVVFTDKDFGSVYSALDFRIISRQILDYIERHPFLTQIKIAVLDLSDLTGLVQLVNRILHLSQHGPCNIGKVEFLILSAREEELKKEMSGLWDSIGTEEVIRFRFGRSGYWDGKQYNMKKITEESDIVFVADNSMLYREPRMVSYTNNGLKNRIQNVNLIEQIKRYSGQYSLDIAVLWDSLQYIAENREDGYRIWKNRELDNGFLAEANRIVSEFPDKAIVLLSSNEHILSEIFRTQYIHAHQGGYNSRNITIIEFENNNTRKRLSDKGQPHVFYSLKEFFYALLNIEDIQKFFIESIKDIMLDFYYNNGETCCDCIVIGQETDDTGTEWKEQCLAWINWQFSGLLSDNSILGIYFRNALSNYLLERAENLPSVLLIERLFQDNFRQILRKPLELYLENEIPQKREKPDPTEEDCMEALKLHEIIIFARGKAGIDEQAISQFKERYEEDLLERLIMCNTEYDLLLEEEKDKLQKIRERI